ncbi:hypothetical protein VHP8226_01799 [Vibrio hippocampi]|uniref:Primosomal replication protein N n=2 Tax=Vibrio hippocampi TaxID=654686 RepID=A0ABN8DG06_9VIBR|nr:hypothetical protein VHP8226_01799 [Vibrio hippocampi]
MNRAQLQAKLSTLHANAERYDRSAKPAALPFDEQLFFTRSEKLLPYVKELNDNFQQLGHSANSERNDYFAERFVNQLQALERFLASREHTQPSSPTQSLLELRESLAQHREWERKLCELVRNKENLASQNQQHLESANEVVIAQQRLNRCRNAIYQLEETIAQQEGFVRGQQKYQ